MVPAIVSSRGLCCAAPAAIEQITKVCNVGHVCYLTSSVARHEGIAKNKHNCNASHISLSKTLQTLSTCMSKTSSEKH
jgi:hypothetical protein